MPVLVLVVAIGLESFSFRTAIEESNRCGAAAVWVEFVRTAKAPELPVVLLEDLGALLGLVFALFGVGLTLLTDDGRWDALGTALIGVLLVVGGGRARARDEARCCSARARPRNTWRAIEAALSGAPGVERIIHMKTLHLGPEELLVAAKIAVGPQRDAADVARRHRRRRDAGARGGADRPGDLPGAGHRPRRRPVLTHPKQGHNVTPCPSSGHGVTLCPSP